MWQFDSTSFEHKRIALRPDIVKAPFEVYILFIDID